MAGDDTQTDAPRCNGAALHLAERNGGESPTSSTLEREPPIGSLGEPTKAARGIKFRRGDHAELSDKLLETLRRLGREDVVYDEGDLYGYDDAAGIYRPIPDWYLTQVVKQFAHAPVFAIDAQTGDVAVDNRGVPRVSHRLQVSTAAISGAIKIAYAHRAHPHFFAEAAPGIAFADCFVRVTADGLHVLPHSPEHRARQTYPFPFPTDDGAPLYEAFLNTVFDGDLDRPEKIAAIEEVHGACITGIATEYERALVLLGEGANGKSRLLRIVSATMPRGSVVAVPPQAWGDQYQRALLAGARLNVVAEMPRAEVLDSEAVKAIISGEQISARHVGEKAITFKPRAGHILAANTLPPTRDRSAGFWRRWIVIEFNRSFEHDPRRDPAIAEKIIAAELPAIIRRALNGAVRLIRQTDYTLPTSHRFALARWRNAVDPVGVFVTVCTEPVQAGPGTPARALYRAMCAWLARARPDMTVTEAEFGRRMTELVGKGRSSSANVYPVRLKEGA